MKLLGETSHAFTQSKAERVSKLIQNNFPSSCISGMEAEITREEVRKTIFAMNQNKGPGPDGFLQGFTLELGLWWGTMSRMQCWSF
jgi:hypothetical protein